MTNAEALFGVGVGGSASSPATQSMRVAYGADGTAVYKSVPSGSPPAPTYHHQSSSAATGGGSEVPAAVHGLNMNVVVGSGPEQQHLPMMMMMKKKRGRPRKYDGGGGGGGGGGAADGTMPLALMPAAAATRPTPPATAAPPPHESAIGGVFSPPSGGGEGSGAGSPPSYKKARGRPPGSTNKKKHHPDQHVQPQPLGSAGVGFTPHVISVQAGEDVSSKIMTFSQNGPRAVCILSANGAISNVTLRQAATSGGTATYEGRFEILSLCGSFLLTEVAGQRSRTGGLSVSLAGPDGRVLGGCVAGLLTAASPVQVIVGSFILDGRKESKSLNHTEPTHFSSPPLPMPMPMSMSMSMSPMLFSGGGGAGGHTAPTAGVSSSRSSQGGSLSESSGGEGSSPPNHSTGGTANNHHNNSNAQGMLGMPWR